MQAQQTRARGKVPRRRMRQQTEDGRYPPSLHAELRLWEHTYNTGRPYQALGCLTPAEFLARSQLHRKEPVSQ